MTIVTVEGFDGAGKTTAIARLACALDKADIPFVVVSEPGGGTENGEHFRSILKGNKTLSKYQQFMLFNASREECYRTTIKQALANDILVITDRGLLSTYAYQIMDLPTKHVSRRGYLDMCLTATGGLTADLVVFLDTDFTTCMDSIDVRGERDAIESNTLAHLEAIHTRMRFMIKTVYPKVEVHLLKRDKVTSVNKVTEAVISMYNSRKSH